MMRARSSSSSGAHLRPARQGGQCVLEEGRSFGADLHTARVVLLSNDGIPAVFYVVVRSIGHVKLRNLCPLSPHLLHPFPDLNILIGCPVTLVELQNMDRMHFVMEMW